MKKVSVLWIVLIQWILGLEWLHAAWSKWTSPEFSEGLPKTLQTFASKNPHQFYVNFINNFALPNASLFAQATRIGELLVAIALLVGGVFLFQPGRLKTSFIWIIALACLVGALMNLNFYFAAGWTSPSTAGINLVMAAIEIILGVFYLKNRSELS